MLTDTHCHLDFSSFDPDRDSVLDRSNSAEIVRIMNPGIDIETSLAASNLANAHSAVYCAVGVHPNSASNWSSLLVDQIKALASGRKVLAIGEIGLDYYRDETPKELQIQAFCDQINIASSLELPIIIHNREATSDIISIVSDWVADLVSNGNSLKENPGVFHSFSGNLKEAEQVIRMNFKIGLTGPITFRNSGELHKIVNAFDVEHFLVETDAPFLAPHPFRGKRNEPAYVRFIAEKIAQIKDLTLDYVANKTTQNSTKVFNW